MEGFEGRSSSHALPLATGTSPYLAAPNVRGESDTWAQPSTIEVALN